MNLDTCPVCGADFDFAGLDVHVDAAAGDVFATWGPCCWDLEDAVSEEGFDAVFGFSVVDAVRVITGYDVLEVTADFDAAVVCRLRIVDPTVVDGDKASSPVGWQREIFDDVDAHHRHHDAPQGWRFGLAVYNGPVRVGVAVVGNPVARKLAEALPGALEVTRVATWGHSALRRNASSSLYAAAGRRARELGADMLVTYTLHHEESGASLRASGFRDVAISSGGSWSRPSRSREDKAPTGRKVRWLRGLTRKARLYVDALPTPTESKQAAFAW